MRETPPFASDLDSRILRLDVAREGALLEATSPMSHAARSRVQRSVRAVWAADAQFEATWEAKGMAQLYADELAEAARAAAQAARAMAASQLDAEEVCGGDPRGLDSDKVIGIAQGDRGRPASDRSAQAALSLIHI